MFTDPVTRCGVLYLKVVIRASSVEALAEVGNCRGVALENLYFIFYIRQSAAICYTIDNHSINGIIKWLARGNPFYIEEVFLMKNVEYLFAALVVLALFVTGACAQTHEIAYEGYTISFDPGDSVKVGNPLPQIDPITNKTIMVFVSIGENITGRSDLKGTEAAISIMDYNGQVNTETRDYEPIVKSLLRHHGLEAVYPQIVPLINGGFTGWAYYPGYDLTIYAEAFGIRGSGDKAIYVGCFDNAALFNKITRTLSVTGPG